MRRPYLWWCLGVVAVQIAGFATIRALSEGAYGAGAGAAPDDVVAQAMVWTGAFGVVGLLTAIGATWSLLRRGSAWAIAVGVGLVTTPALLLSGFACLVSAVSLGW